MHEKLYNGYKSYAYLTANKDYKQYELSYDLDRVPAYTLDLTDCEKRS